MSRKRNEGIANSMRQAATILGRTYGEIKAARDKGCPGFMASGRVEIETVRQWLEKNPVVLAPPEVRKASASARHEELKVERIAFRNEVEKGKYYSREQVAERLLALATQQATVMRQKIEHEFPGLLANRTTDEIRVECVRLVDELCRMMQTFADEWNAQPDKQKELL